MSAEARRHAADRIRTALDDLPASHVDGHDVLWVEGSYGDHDIRTIRLADLTAVLDGAAS